MSSDLQSADNQTAFHHSRSCHHRRPGITFRHLPEGESNIFTFLSRSLSPSSGSQLLANPSLSIVFVRVQPSLIYYRLLLFHVTLLVST